jgi:hypothetical protein
LLKKLHIQTAKPHPGDGVGKAIYLFARNCHLRLKESVAAEAEAGAATLLSFWQQLQQPLRQSFMGFSINPLPAQATQH